MAIGEEILTASVSASAAAGAITTVWPLLVPVRMYLALATNVTLWFLNRMGMQNASKVFKPIVWSFVGLVTLLGISALVRWSMGWGFNEIKQSADAIEQTGKLFTAFVFLKAFANACSALTGVEATSDRSNAFVNPSEAVKSLVASATMITIGTAAALTATILTGIVPHEGEALLVLLGEAIWGPVGKTAMAIAGYLILFAAGSVAFADFPQVLANMAKNAEAPRHFKFEGARALVYDYGCNLLMIISCLIIYIYQGMESKQIPLYSVGVFFMVAASQSGMAMHWLHTAKLKGKAAIETSYATLAYDPSWRTRMVVCICSTFVVTAVFIVIASTKFMDGAWIMLLINAPILVLLQWFCAEHYKKVACQLRLEQPSNVSLSREGPLTVILAADANRQLENLVKEAQGRNQYLVHIYSSHERLQKFYDDIARVMPKIDMNRIVVKEAEFRQIFEPALAGVQEVERLVGEKPTVILGELEIPNGNVIQNWVHNFLHMGTGRTLRRSFGKYGYRVTTNPFFLN